MSNNIKNWYLNYLLCRSGAAIELEDSPTLSTKSDLGEEPFFTSIGEHIVVEEVESPGEEGKEETLSHQPLIKEPEDPEETIVAEEVLDGEYSLFGGGVEVEVDEIIEVVVEETMEVIMGK